MIFEKAQCPIDYRHSVTVYGGNRVPEVCTPVPGDALVVYVFQQAPLPTAENDNGQHREAKWDLMSEALSAPERRARYLVVTAHLSANAQNPKIPNV